MEKTCRLFLLFLAMPCLEALPATSKAPATLQKKEDVVIYQDPHYYAAFPSIVRRKNGELLVAFRRAPERRAFFEPTTSHTDPNSYLVLVRSRDGGKSWSPSPELMFAHPLGGSQDPCLLQLRNGNLICSSYGWARLEKTAIGRLKKPFATHGDFIFLGGFLLFSKDGGNEWEGPHRPPVVPGEPNLDIFGKGIPAYNRGAMCEGRDGKIFWAVASNTTNAPSRTGVHLMVSTDQGRRWNYSAPIAVDEKIEFNETSMHQTPAGDLVAFLRTANFADKTVVARSRDGGKSFNWEDAGFQGHPHYALTLPDQRVLLVYGYRHPPFGIRARILNAECTDFRTAQEVVLRDDGGNGDIGYPWATMVSKKRLLVVYYFNKADGPRHIAGTFLELNTP